MIELHEAEKPIIAIIIDTLTVLVGEKHIFLQPHLLRNIDSIIQLL